MINGVTGSMVEVGGSNTRSEANASPELCFSKHSKKYSDQISLSEGDKFTNLNFYSSFLSVEEATAITGGDRYHDSINDNINNS